MRGLAAAGHRLAETVGLVWALGLALYTAVYFALYFAGMSCPAAVAPALVIAVLGVAGGAVALQAARRDEPYGDGGSAPLVVAAGLAVAAVQVGIAAWMAVHSQLRFWDAWFVWAVKARMFASEGPPPGYFRGALGPVAHPDYPLNLVLAEGSFFRLPGTIGIDLASLIGAACFGALVLLFYTGLARLYGRNRAALATALLALVPVVPKWAGLGYADVPLALYAGASALYLLLWWQQRERVDLVLMGLLAGGAIWTKKEGLAVAALLLLACAVEEALRDGTVAERLSAVLAAAAAMVAIPLPWLIFTRTAHPLATDFWPLTPSVFRAHAGRLPHILGYFAREMLALTHWSLFWFAVAAVIVLAGLYQLSRHGRLLLLLLCAQLAVYALSFVFSYWTPYTAHITTSLDRLLLHTVPWAVLLIVEATQALMPVGSHRQLSAAGTQISTVGSQPSPSRP